MNYLFEKGIDIPNGAIENQEQAERWVESLLREMLGWRQACDIPVPCNNDKAAQDQRRTLWTFLNKQGQVIGALKTLRLCGLISDRCYAELNQKAINTLIPTTVGEQ